jgi:DNA-directed RNA polymerase subunit E'/Rpb7
MIKVHNICLTVNISPDKHDCNILKTIHDKVSFLLLKKEMKDTGLITEIIKIKNVYGGEILSSGTSKYSVDVSVKAYMPKIGEKIKTIVNEVSLHGYYVNEPVQTFVGTVKKPTVVTGDKVTIKITKVGFNQGHFVVIAESSK